MEQGLSDDDVDVRIAKLKERVRELTGPFVDGTAEDCPPELAERFWNSVLAFETAPRVPPFDLLLDSGISLPPPEELDDAALTPKLWEIINALSVIGFYLDHTDHLSDRELYSRLWREELREPEEILPPELEAACHIDLAESGSEESLQLYLKYYADESARRMWAQDSPELIVPDHEDPPFDRDRLLP